MIEVALPQKIKLVFSYDSFHRRLSKTKYSWENTWVEEATFEFLYDGQNEIGEVQNGTYKNLRILGNVDRAEIGSAVALELEGKVFAPIHDLCGNVACLVDTRGEIFEEYRYSAFGEEIDRIDSINPWRFSSKRTDEETKLVYYGRRYYHPHIGRWITQDPKGYTDSYNLYAFVNNNPLTHVDLYGLEKENTFTFDKDIQRMQQSVMYSTTSLSYYSLYNPLLRNPLEDEFFFQKDPIFTREQNPNLYGAIDSVASIKNGAHGLCGFVLGYSEVLTGIKVSAFSNTHFNKGRFVGREAANATRMFLLGHGTWTMSIGGTAMAFAPATWGTSTAPGAMALGIGSVEVVLGQFLKYNYSKLDKIEFPKKLHKNTAGNLQQQVVRGKAPKTIDRVDKGRGFFEKDHVHFKDKAALNIDGTWKHKQRTLSNQEIQWLEQNGWKFPK